MVTDKEGNKMDTIKGMKVRVGDTIRCMDSGGMDITVLSSYASEAGIHVNAANGRFLVPFDETVILVARKEV